MTDTARGLVVRALNYWRQYHLETYVGLRYLAAPSAVNDESPWLTDLVTRKAITKRGDRTLIFPRFKKRDANGSFDYREFVARSPLEALIETQILLRLRDIDGFQNRPNVYSYRWPSRVSEKRIFEYYWVGYAERNREIANVTKTLTNPAIVIADVKSFYPSLNRDILRRHIGRILSSGDGSDDNVVLRNHLESSLSLGPGGRVPIGPPTSHVLANLAMSDMDASLSAKYGRHYFRYVDDIAIVCEKGRADEALHDIESALTSIDLKLNPEKTDIIDGASWTSRFASDASTESNSFERLITRATLACALFPERLSTFQQVCRDLNLLFPDKRLMDRSHSSRYRRWLHVLLRRRVHSVGAAVQLDAKTFAIQLSDLRRTLEEEAQRLFSIPPASTPMARRWQLQDQRYVLNRLFYLTPLGELGKLLEYAPADPDHLEFRSLVVACISGNPESLLQFPGPAVASFCSVADKIGSGSIPKSRLFRPSRANAAALSNLYISGALEPRDEIKEASAEDTRLLQFARFNPSPARDDWKIDYLDEIHSLQAGFDRGSTRDLLMTRYDWEEDVMLEALTIGGDGYYSA